MNKIIFKKNIASKSSSLNFEELTNDSRNVTKNSVFVAVKGTSSDGHEFLPEVCKLVSLIVIENEKQIPAGYGGNVLIVECTKAALAQLARLFYSRNIEQMNFYGVTGTNGKTSTTYIIENLLKYFEVKVGVLGTNNHRLGNKIWTSQLTTPAPIQLHQRLNEMQELEASSIAMEVSSHALDQKRVAAINYDVALFTNLTLDHLDYHQNFDEYFAAKHKLFTDHLNVDAVSIINGDDKYAAKINPSVGRRFTFGNKARNDFVFKIINENISGCQFQIIFNKEKHTFHSPLIGMHNVYNVVGSVIALWSQGFKFDKMVEAVKQLPMIPGRLESVNNQKNLNVFVDYAHTNDALEKVLQVLANFKAKKNTSSKLCVVFGCGGDRDKSKRPLMFEAAKKYADICVVTSDNPRTEDPDSIIADIIQGQTFKTSVHVEVDRKKAILKAVQMCNEDDILLIAGKGHEDYQVIGTEKIHFSDHEVVREAINAI